MLRLYDYFESGNAYKVRLLLHQLDLPFEQPLAHVTIEDDVGTLATT